MIELPCRPDAPRATAVRREPGRRNGGDVPNVQPKIKIVNCGSSATSAIVQILQGKYDSDVEMPAGGPYFPAEQVAEFAKWIVAGCRQ